MRTMLLFLALGTLAWAQPSTGQFDVKIVREYEENGESKRAEFNPSFRIAPTADGQLRVNDQTLAMPALPDQNAQQAFNSLMKMFAAQAGPMFSQFGNGEPFRMILELPNMKEKLDIELTPRVENP